MLVWPSIYWVSFQAEIFPTHNPTHISLSGLFWGFVRVQVCNPLFHHFA